MPRLVLLFGAALLAFALAACAAPVAQDAGHAGHAMGGSLDDGTVIDPPGALVDFSLPSSAGSTLSLGALKGRPTLLFFGFASCPDFCPTTLADFVRVKQALGADGAGVNYVMISVDPERDTPAALASYLQKFDPAFIGLQGDDATLRKISRDYGLYYERGTPAADNSYNVEHSPAIYLIDAQGMLRIVYTGSVPVETYVRDLRGVLGG